MGGRLLKKGVKVIFIGNNQEEGRTIYFIR